MLPAFEIFQIFRAGMGRGSPSHCAGQARAARNLHFRLAPDRARCDSVPSRVADAPLLIPMTADPVQPTPATPPGAAPGSSAGLLGIFGLGLLLIGALTMFVIVMEYDPEGREIKRGGKDAIGEIIESSESPAGERRIRFQFETADGRRIVTEHAGRLSRSYFRAAKPGYSAEIVYLPERPERASIVDALPHAPRNLSDGIFPALLLALAALMLVFDPLYLYIGMGRL
jgi:hypothetical protein